MAETWNALRARLADMGERHPSATVRDVCREVLDELDALRPLAVLGARVLNAYAAQGPWCSSYGLIAERSALHVAGTYATPHIAATVARLKDGSDGA